MVSGSPAQQIPPPYPTSAQARSRTADETDSADGPDGTCALDGIGVDGLGVADGDDAADAADAPLLAAASAYLDAGAESGTIAKDHADGDAHGDTDADVDDFGDANMHADGDADADDASSDISFDDDVDPFMNSGNNSSSNNNANNAFDSSIRGGNNATGTPNAGAPRLARGILGGDQPAPPASNLSPAIKALLANHGTFKATPSTLVATPLGAAASPSIVTLETGTKPVNLKF